MIGFFNTPNKMEDLALFTRHVSGAMSARVPLPDILRAYIAEAERGALANAVSAMIPRIESGVELSAAMDEHPKHFPNMVRRLVRLGEQGHALAGIMEQLADTLDEGLKSYEQTRRAAIYPLMVMLVLFLNITGIAIFIAPKFDDIFLQMGGAVIHPLGMSWPLLLKIAAGLVLIPIAFLLSALAGLHVRGFGPGRMLLQIPLIGPTLRLAESARFAHYLAMLVENRVPMAEALGLLSEASDNSYVQAALHDFHQRYQAGERLGDLLAGQPLFPAGMAVLVSSAEDQGGLADTLHKLGKYYQERTIHANTVMREVFEPIMLVLIGLFLSIALVMIYGPLFGLSKNIR